MSVKNKGREKHDPKVATVTGEAFDELGSLDWIGIPEFPYIMKYKFDEDGYMLMVSDLAAVYGEKLDEKAIQERFQVLNPYAEMLPKVILKHVKQSVKNILEGENAREETKLKITCDSNLVTIQHQFNVNGVRFIFNFEPQMLSGNQFKAHILRPALLRSFIYCEEKAALQSKVEELEGRPSCSSSSESSESRKMKAMYSAIKEFDAPVSGVIDAFLYLQKGKIILPKSLKGTSILSPTKRVNSSSISSSQRNWLMGTKDASINLPYEEDDSDVSLESQQSEEPEISMKVEKTEIDDDDDADMKLFHVLVNNLSAKSKSMKESNKRVSPKREMDDDDSKEDSASEPTSSLEPSPSKKKKLFKF